MSFRAYHKLAAHLGLLISVGALLTPVAVYYLNFHDVPFIPVAALSLIFLYAAAKTKLWHIFGAFALFLGVTFLPALMPPQNPISNQSHGSLNLSLGPLEGDTRVGAELKFSDSLDPNLESYDFEGASVFGSVSPILGESGYIYYGSDMRHRASAFAPSWARNLSLVIRVPVYPRKPVRVVRVPVDRIRTPMPAGSDVKVERYEDSGLLEAGEHLKDCFISVRASGQDNGYTPFRIRDERGRVVRFRLGRTGNGPDVTYLAQMHRIRPDITYFDVELFSADDLGQDVREFKFRRLPIRRDE